MAGDYSISLFHILFVGPLLLGIGLYHDNPNFPKIIWQMLIILGIGIMAYHSWRAWSRYKILNQK
jgi:disulfide bond formation protein DsbB